MKMFTPCLLTLLVLGLFATPGRAAVSAAFVTIDGEQFFVPFSVEPGTGHYIFSGNGQTADADGGSFTLSGDIDPGADPAIVDPFIALGLMAVDFGAPSTFSVIVGTPIIPIGTPNIVRSQLDGTLTDANFDGVFLTLVNTRVLESTVSAPGTTMGVDVGLGAIFGSDDGGPAFAYGPFASGPKAGPGPGPWTFLSVELAFMLSGGDDTASLNAMASILPDGAPAVPEPASAAVALAGVMALGLRRRR